MNRRTRGTLNVQPPMVKVDVGPKTGFDGNLVELLIGSDEGAVSLRNWNRTESPPTPAKVAGHPCQTCSQESPAQHRPAILLKLLQRFEQSIYLPLRQTCDLAIALLGHSRQMQLLRPDSPFEFTTAKHHERPSRRTH